ncbi:MAG: tetratricopeptide repeat protein [Kiritimatiellia bacterium]
MKKKIISVVVTAVLLAIVIFLLVQNRDYILLSPEERAFKSLDRQTYEEFITANHSNLPAHAEELIGMDPNRGEGYYWRGVVATMEGRFRDAIKDLEKAVELNPEHADANAYLGWARDVQPFADPEK